MISNVNRIFCTKSTKSVNQNPKDLRVKDATDENGNKVTELDNIDIFHIGEAQDGDSDLVSFYGANLDNKSISLVTLEGPSKQDIPVAKQWQEVSSSLAFSPRKSIASERKDSTSPLLEKSVGESNDVKKPLLSKASSPIGYQAVDDKNLHIRSELVPSREGFCKRSLPVICTGLVGAAVGSLITWLIMRGGHNVSNNAVPDNSLALTAAAELFSNVINPNASNPAQIMQNNGFDLNNGKVTAVLDNYNLTRIYINDIEKQEDVDTSQVAANIIDFINGGNKTACFDVKGSVSAETCSSLQTIASLAKGNS